MHEFHSEMFLLESELRHGRRALCFTVQNHILNLFNTSQPQQLVYSLPTTGSLTVAVGPYLHTHPPTYLPTYISIYLYQPVARPLPTHRTTQTQNKRTQTSTRFEPMIPVFERATATVIGGGRRLPLKIPAPTKHGSPHHWKFSKVHTGPRFAHGFQPSACIGLYKKTMQATGRVMRMSSLQYRTRRSQTEIILEA
jgi:hypothetical protein